MCTYTRGGPRVLLSLIRRTFADLTQNLTGEISGRAQSLARNGHPSI